MQIKCPHCKKLHDVNPGKMLIMQQINKLSEEERSERGRRLAKARWGLSTTKK